jgi:hypothetical protein
MDSRTQFSNSSLLLATGTVVLALMATVLITLPVTGKRPQPSDRQYREFAAQKNAEIQLRFKEFSPGSDENRPAFDQRRSNAEPLRNEMARIGDSIQQLIELKRLALNSSQHDVAGHPIQLPSDQFPSERYPTGNGSVSPNNEQGLAGIQQHLQRLDSELTALRMEQKRLQSSQIAGTAKPPVTTDIADASPGDASPADESDIDTTAPVKDTAVASSSTAESVAESPSFDDPTTSADSMVPALESTALEPDESPTVLADGVPAVSPDKEQPETLDDEQLFPDASPSEVRDSQIREASSRKTLSDAGASETPTVPEPDPLPLFSEELLPVPLEQQSADVQPPTEDENLGESVSLPDFSIDNEEADTEQTEKLPAPAAESDSETSGDAVEDNEIEGELIFQQSYQPRSDRRPPESSELIIPGDGHPAAPEQLTVASPVPGTVMHLQPVPSVHTATANQSTSSTLNIPAYSHGEQLPADEQFPAGAHSQMDTSYQMPYQMQPAELRQTPRIVSTVQYSVPNTSGPASASYSQPHQQNPPAVTYGAAHAARPLPARSQTDNSRRARTGSLPGLPRIPKYLLPVKSAKQPSSVQNRARSQNQNVHHRHSHPGQNQPQRPMLSGMDFPRTQPNHGSPIPSVAPDMPNGNFVTYPDFYPDFDTPGWVSDVSDTMPEPPEFGSQVLHRASSVIRFAGRPRALQ